MSGNTIQASDSIIQVVMNKNNQNRISPLLALHENGVTTKNLEHLRCVGGEGNDGVVIDNCIVNPSEQSVGKLSTSNVSYSHQRIWFLPEDGSCSVVLLLELCSINTIRLCRHAGR